MRYLLPLLLLLTCLTSCHTTKTTTDNTSIIQSQRDSLYHLRHRIDSLREAFSNVHTEHTTTFLHDTTYVRDSTLIREYQDSLGIMHRDATYWHYAYSRLLHNQQTSTQDSTNISISAIHIDIDSLTQAISDSLLAEHIYTNTEIIDRPYIPKPVGALALTGIIAILYLATKVYKPPRQPNPRNIE